MKTTVIAGRDIPVQPGPTTKLAFSGAPNPDDNALFEFWTNVAGEMPIDVARQQAGKDPGERWRREEGNPDHAYRGFNERAKTTTLLRPANQRELLLWLDGHLDDFKFAADSCEVGGVVYRLKKK